MSRTQSAMVELGTVAPAFELMDVVTGKAVGRDDVFAMSWDDDRPDALNKMTGGGASKIRPSALGKICNAVNGSKSCA